MEFQIFSTHFNQEVFDTFQAAYARAKAVNAWKLSYTLDGVSYRWLKQLWYANDIYAQLSTDYANCRDEQAVFWMNKPLTFEGIKTVAVLTDAQFRQLFKN